MTWYTEAEGVCECRTKQTQTIAVLSTPARVNLPDGHREISLSRPLFPSRTRGTASTSSLTTAIGVMSKNRPHTPGIGNCRVGELRVALG